MPTPLRPRDLRPVYLTGERLYIRPLLLEDKDHAAAWFPSPYPINAVRAEEFIHDVHKGAPSREFHFVIARLDDDAIVGGVKLGMNSRVGDLAFRMAPWLPDADERRAEALTIAVRWLRADWELMTVTVELPADQPLTIAAAERAGMFQAVRLRQHVARPGGRVDLFWYQALNPRWVVPADARAASEEAADA